ncbi:MULTISPECIES: lytic transglycosylase domain-containing protein [Streptomyces]|uniref:Lytic transglycosylase n=2 Tax=Streptomyces TaxID=1883 RepID=A0A100Y1K0_9ACTN|nr:MULTISPECIES: lytic murein transglycosylase [Streptomyces]KUH35987.1 lytic transglycosylase [Streptomyces kanasensis]UUS30541.1 lytic murein transglycosylase [Streptomyces changanensis]
MAAHIGRRLRKGATTTAVAAAAVAALSASQAPGATPIAGGQTAGGSTPPTPSGSTATGDSPYYTDLPPLKSPNPLPPGSAPDGLLGTGPAEAGIPATVLAAYKQAEQHLKTTKPGCNLPWQLLAGIGKVESGQARGGRVDANGTTPSPILGPVLNGNGFANITDTDNGAYDGDARHDRAVGPMQFIPSTWASWGQDANGDGRKDPNNIFDAAQAAGMYLCANNRDLALKADLDRAILSYNQSREYLRTVLSWFEFYKRGTHQVPDGSGVQPGDISDPVTSPVGPGADPVPSTPVTTPSPTPTPTPTPPTPTPTPSTPGAKPTPSKPSQPPTSKPTPPKPQPTPTPTPTPPPKPTTPLDRLHRLVVTGAGTLTAPAGTEFPVRPVVTARDAWGKVLGGVPVRFEVIGDTDASFPGGETVVTVTTGADGTATAPVLDAGERTGQFTVRAAVPQRPAVGPADFAATVTSGQADALVRTGDAALSAAPEGEFAEQVTVKATRKGAPVAGVALTATVLVKAADGSLRPAEEGPFFKDGRGEPLRALAGLKTDADGVLQLPKLYADGRTGTFLLSLTAQGGTTLTVELHVTAA